MSDTYEDWPFASGSRGDELNDPDKTEDLISKLIEADILEDNGIDYQDENDLENIFILKIL